jgi:hypothetical protein
VLLEAFAPKDNRSNGVADRWLGSARRTYAMGQQIPGRDEFDGLWTGNLIAAAP